jgi:hypothetical protein
MHPDDQAAYATVLRAQQPLWGTESATADTLPASAKWVRRQFLKTGSDKP